MGIRLTDYTNHTCTHRGIHRTHHSDVSAWEDGRVHTEEASNGWLWCGTAAWVFWSRTTFTSMYNVHVGLQCQCAIEPYSTKAGQVHILQYRDNAVYSFDAL